MAAADGFAIHSHLLELGKENNKKEALEVRVPVVTAGDFQFSGLNDYTYC